jgi:serine/threonine-protein kinase
MDPAAQTTSFSTGPSGSEQVDVDLSGRTLRDFQLLRRVGQGGMGQVYLARQISLKRNVAVKIMRPDLAVSAVAYERFRAEAEAVARLTHANIVQVYDFGEEAGLHYMALEYVEGRNLRDYISKKGPPELPLALSIMRQVAAALQRAGELGIVHRDIKPENILLTRRGEVKVADFGLSRCYAEEQRGVHLTQPGLAMGTPLYMSPEQIQGQPLDPRTDIYSLGVTCYHMLTGQPPFRGQSALELAIQHVQTEPRPLQEIRPDLPADFCGVIHKMMAKQQEQRYQSCALLLKDIARVRESFGGQKTETAAATTAPALTVTPPAATPTLPAPVFRSRWLSGVAVAAIALALLAGGALAWMRNQQRASGQEALGQKSVSLPPVLTEMQRQENFMREAVEQYSDPGKDPMRVDLGLKHALELGLFYLKQQRLDDADRFFLDLRDNRNKVEAYRTLGLLGHAIVLGLENQPAESNRAFLDLVGDKARAGKPPDRLPFLLNQAPLRYEIARALDYNRINLPASQPLPPALEALRKPAEWWTAPEGGLRRPGQNRKLGKTS